MKSNEDTEFEKSYSNFFSALQKIQEIRVCRNCTCFVETVKYLGKECMHAEINPSRKEFMLKKLGKWYTTAKNNNIHDCLHCDTCLPDAPCTKFITDLKKFK